MIAVGERGVIQAQKYDRTVDQTAANGSHVVEPRARKLYTPVDQRRWNWKRCGIIAINNETYLCLRKCKLNAKKANAKVTPMLARQVTARKAAGATVTTLNLVVRNKKKPI